MRGRPILQAVLFAALWGMLAFPVAWVSKGDRAATIDEMPHQGANGTTWASMRFSALPAAFELRQGERVLCQATGIVDLEQEKSLPVAFDEYGAELQFVADMPDTDVAIEVRLEPDERAPRAVTVWGRGRIEERIEFSWGRDE